MSASQRPRRPHPARGGGTRWLPTPWLATRCIALAATLVGCGTEFDPGSEVEGLRVLGLKKSAPYARPGQRVELELLWHDTEPLPAGQAAPQIAWVALCENPPADLYEQCFTQFPAFSEAELSERVSLPEPGASIANDRFGFTVARDIISSRPPPPDPDTTPYGLNIVFFAACAGELFQRDAASGFPLGCYEELDGEPGFSAGDRQLDSRRFVVGYTSVYAYDEISNRNPVLTGIEFDGVTFVPETASGPPPAGAVALPAEDLCIGSSCLDAAPAADAECPDALTLDNCDEECAPRQLRPLIDPSNAELDAVASRRSGETLTEQMWVNYYAAGGEVDEEVRLLNDVTTGWNDDFATEYEPLGDAGIAYVWAVAHDNRGGTEWARLRLCLRDVTP